MLAGNSTVVLPHHPVNKGITKCYQAVVHQCSHIIYYVPAHKGIVSCYNKKHYNSAPTSPCSQDITRCYQKAVHCRSRIILFTRNGKMLAGSSTWVLPHLHVHKESHTVSRKQFTGAPISSCSQGTGTCQQEAKHGYTHLFLLKRNRKMLAENQSSRAV